MNKFEWLSRLVAFDTTSRNSNLELINFINESLLTHHIETKLIRDSTQSKANLFAILPAQNGNRQGGLILSGHTDVVPVDGQEWQTNPFIATQLQDKIMGRGTCDMKGFIAVVLSLVPYFLKCKLIHPIYFSFSYDEEIGCLGVPSLIDAVKAMDIKPKACIVGEPTNMTPVVAHKGKQIFRCTLHGAAAHSSLTTSGCNAIEHAARLICFIRDLADTYQTNGPFDPYFDVPFTSLATTLIQGGNSQNTIPDSCEFTFEFRNLPEDNAHEIRKKIDDEIHHELLPKMRRENSNAKVIVDYIGGAPGLSISEDDPLTQLVRKLTNEHAIKKVAYGTEAGLFQEADIPTIICGPGSIDQAHRANEYVTIDQLNKCEAFIKGLIN